MKMPRLKVLFFVGVLSLGWSSGANTSMTGQPPLPQSAATKTPAVEIDPDTGEHKISFSVLIYNIAGLPWPIKSGRAKRLAMIADKFAQLRSQGRAPDLVLLQEAFMDESRDIIQAGGYRNYIAGPRADDVVEGASPDASADFLDDLRNWRGETWGKVMNSGLYILSDFPIVGAHKAAFPRRDCAGWDCLANKGVMMAWVRIPGVPFPLEVVNTHMNSKGPSSGVDYSRTSAAQKLQLGGMRRLIEQNSDSDNPLIVAGDFNLKGLPELVEQLKRHSSPRPAQQFSREYCLEAASGCELRLDVKSATPWLDSNDLQAFDSGRHAHLRPVRVELIFDEIIDGEPLSDHDGYLVQYELRWIPEQIPQQTAGL
ncbi:endonuclease/exonuclease/phosphatase family protein [Emcibacter nanhaiensis]|uniref:Endonuclease/exonuclease/phosphatase domain-containing protein n=1 Tax=Emcibacter nanhaiensis TaxID=1505037 RepID=A0A501PP29_9PROT|nr:endonuclease/exonuclease/phosphatase family protein [Emcibacter nanhaiensis]TPD61744.1 hypothetical protein FIV46_05930 [Emcibacter nanhaiensis]